MQKAYDLSALRAVLLDHPEYRELAKQITRYVSAKSFERDLLSALSSLAELQHVNLAGAKSRNSIGQALMIHAIVMYCRAAIEDGKGRAKIGVTKSYTAGQMEKHRHVVKLRNKSIAHFDIGEGDYGRDWVKESVVMIDRGGVLDIRDVWSRRNYLGQLAFDLHDLCQTALENVQSAARVRCREMGDAVSFRMRHDPKFSQLMVTTPFIPENFFASQDGVKAFWAGEDVHMENHTPMDFNGASLTPAGGVTSTKI